MAQSASLERRAPLFADRGMRDHTVGPRRQGLLFFRVGAGEQGNRPQAVMSLEARRIADIGGFSVVEAIPVREQRRDEMCMRFDAR